MTEIPIDKGKLFLSTAIGLFSRRLLGFATSTSPVAEPAGQVIKMAVAVRGGKDRVAGVVFHSDRGSTYTARDFTSLCVRLGITQSMGRVGSCFDNAAAESFFSTRNTRYFPGSTPPQFLWPTVPNRLRDHRGQAGHIEEPPTIRGSSIA